MAVEDKKIKLKVTKEEDTKVVLAKDLLYAALKKKLTVERNKSDVLVCSPECSVMRGILEELEMNCDARYVTGYDKRYVKLQAITSKMFDFTYKLSHGGITCRVDNEDKLVYGKRQTNLPWDYATQLVLERVAGEQETVILREAFKKQLHYVSFKSLKEATKTWQEITTELIKSTESINYNTLGNLKVGDLKELERQVYYSIYNRKELDLSNIPQISREQLLEDSKLKMPSKQIDLF